MNRPSHSGSGCTISVSYFHMTFRGCQSKVNRISRVHSGKIQFGRKIESWSFVVRYKSRTFALCCGILFLNKYFLPLCYLKVAFFQKVLMHLSYPYTQSGYTCDHLIFLSLKIWILVTEICFKFDSLEACTAK